MCIRAEQGWFWCNSVSSVTCEIAFLWAVCLFVGEHLYNLKLSENINIPFPGLK